MLLLPMGADQPLNAARCAALGVARVLDPLAATAEQVRSAALAMLGDNAARVAAGRIRDEVAALPDLSLALALLEDLAPRGEAA